MFESIIEIARQLRARQLSSAALVAQCIERAGRSDHVFIRLDADQARRQALEVDKARAAGAPLAPFAGIPITLKDLFDVAGQVTTAGSRVLAGAPAASRDAPVVRRLRDAGFIFLGRVNMSEFAFSGMGTNPHYGTPLCIWDRATGRLPGGSSSGSGVSVAEGIVPGSIGSDTAGSTRIPAAFNGVVGYKPTYGRFPLDGIYPLSPTTDAPGPLTGSVACCYVLDAVMSGLGEPAPLNGRPAGDISLLLPDADVMGDLDSVVGPAFERAVTRLTAAGCRVESRPMPALDGLLKLFQTKPLATHEAWLAHRERIAERGDRYDPFVSWRIATGADISARDYQETLHARRGLIEEFNRAMTGFDAVIYPTVAMVPPPLSDVSELEAARPVNFRCLRNTATVNYFDGCAISIPCHRRGDAPVGLMLSAAGGRDLDLFRVARTAEAILKAL